MSFLNLAILLGNSVDQESVVNKKGVKLPSDLSGLLYKKVSDNVEEIVYGLIKEIKKRWFRTKNVKKPNHNLSLHLTPKAWRPSVPVSFSKPAVAASQSSCCRVTK